MKLGKLRDKSASKSLRQYYCERNHVLINREIGGLGDILMHRMMFEDIHKSGLEVHFSCPRKYHEAVIDHPYISRLLDCVEIDPRTYNASFNTTTACTLYETHIAPKSDLHRSDIWSRHCGFQLTNHNMHVVLSAEEKEYGREIVGKISKGLPTVAFCPLSAMMFKDLQGIQVTGVLDGLRDRGFSPFGLHHKPILEVQGKRVPMVYDLSIRQWMSVINAADYVIAVDTAAFHLAGGLSKPTVGVFSIVNGSVYGKYFNTIEVVQGSCPMGHHGCYVWDKCPVKEVQRKPCITTTKSGDVIDAFDRLCGRFPPVSHSIKEQTFTR
jgi:hypothetical protein